jgi:hypothetical protein
MPSWASYLLLPLMLPCASHERVSTPVAESVATLSDRSPEARIRIERSVLADAPAVLELTLTKVDNKQRTPFSIFVSIVWFQRGEPWADPRGKLRIGQFSVHPSDSPGTYLLRSSGAFAHLSELAVDPESVDFALLLEMERVSESQPWTHVTVSIAEPRWRAEPEERN